MKLGKVDNKTRKKYKKSAFLFNSIKFAGIEHILYVDPILSISTDYQRGLIKNSEYKKVTQL